MNRNNKPKITVIAEYVVTDNPIDGRLVCVHYSDGKQKIVRK